jgi:hypothetical protein
MTMSVNVDDVIATYMKLRDQKAAIEGEVKDKVAAIKTKMEKLEAWIKEKADAEGVTSFKTKHGTAFLTTTDYANVADWDAVLELYPRERCLRHAGKACEQDRSAWVH